MSTDRTSAAGSPARARTRRRSGSRPAWLRFTLPPLLALGLLFSLLGPAVAGSPEERRLEETRRKIAAVREQIEAAKSERAGRAQDLAEAEQQLATVMEALAAAELAVQRQQQQVAEARAELERLEDAEARQQQIIANRAVELYRQGTSASIATVLAAESTEEALQRSTYIEVLSRADRTAIESVEIAQTAVDAQRRTLQAEEETLQRVAEQQQAIVAEARALRDERALVLAGSEQKLAELEAQERHLEAESREIAALARRASRAEASARTAAATSGGAASGAAPMAAPPAATGGGWTWPASGSLTSGYGSRWGRLHAGIDIGAPTGSAVVAARAGRVIFAGRHGGYGNLVLVDHGGGIVTAYAHLSSFAVGVGASVSAGQLLGGVGCTGSCTGPHLHFEVRVNGTPQNPRNFLG